MAGTAALQQTLYDEMLSRIAEDDESPPYLLGTHLYFARVTKGSQYPVYLRKKTHRANAAEQVVLDLNELAAEGGGKEFVSVAAIEISDDEDHVAYLEDTAGFRQYVLHTKNLVSGQTSNLAIARVDGVAFSADGNSLYYVTEDEQTKRADKLFRHVIGDDPSTDALLYEETDEMYILQIERSRSKRFLFVTSASKTTSEVRLIDLQASDPRSAAAAPRVVATRRPHVEYYCDHHDEHLYILTNDTGRNFRLVKTLLASTDPLQWTEVLPERPQVMLEGMQIFRQQLVLAIRQDALPALEVLDFASGETRLIPQSEAVYDLHPVDNHDLDQKAVRVRYHSPHHRTDVHRLRSGHRRADRRARAEDPRLRPEPLPDGARHHHRTRRTHRDSRLARLRQGYQARWHASALSLRVRLVRHLPGARLLARATVAARPRHRPRSRPHPRRAAISASAGTIRGASRPR